MLLNAFAIPLRFIELRFNDLHFLCMTPPTCALLCPSFSLRVKTSPHLCLSKLSLASPLPIKTVLCIPSLCESMSINAVPLLIDARPLRCCSNQHLRITQSFTGSLCHSLCYPELSHCHSALSKSVALQSTNCHHYQYHHHSCVRVPICAGL